ncbi:hypothetical protein Tco_0596126 [Tanacetum coccineum]
MGSVVVVDEYVCKWLMVVVMVHGNVAMAVAAISSFRRCLPYEAVVLSLSVATSGWFSLRVVGQSRPELGCLPSHISPRLPPRHQRRFYGGSILSSLSCRGDSQLGFLIRYPHHPPPPDPPRNRTQIRNHMVHRRIGEGGVLRIPDT